MYAPQGAPVMAPRKTSGAAIASLVLGIVGFCIGWIPLVGPFIALASSILAIILGAVGIKQVNANPQLVGGKGLAIAGLVLGIIALALWLLAITFLAAVFAQLGREAGRAFVPVL
jgi:hypothetical protein